MEIDKALSQISEIHAHVARAEVYRDVKSLPIVVAGVLALLAAQMQHPLLGTEPGVSFVYYWMGIAAICALIGGGGILRDSVLHANGLARRRTMTVLGQFCPCLAAGLLVTIATLTDARLLAFIPGLWAILFGLGVFAARPYLPRMIGYAALFYLGAGGVLLALAPSGASLNPWGMGIAFGVGHILTGCILYWNLERGSHGQE